MTVIRNLTVVAALISLLAVTMLSRPVSAFASKQDCCLGHSKRSIPFRIISGYAQQESNEMCDIDAIIFYTVRGRAVCADPTDVWVKQILKFLSKKLEKMSQKD